MFAQIAVGEHGVSAIRLVDRLEQHPATDEALFVGLGGGSLGSHRREVVGTVLELHPVDRQRTTTLIGDDEVGNALRRIFQRSRLCEPLVAQVAAEASHHRISGCPSRRFWRTHRHLEASDDLSLRVFLTNAELGVVSSLGIQDDIAVLDAAEVNVGVFQPTAFRGQRGLETAEGVDRVYQLRSNISRGGAVAVNLNLLGGLVDTHATHRLLHLLNGTVRIEKQFLNLYRTALVIAGREGVLVIE